MTSANGFYNIAAVPPGEYTARFTRIGFSPVERQIRLQIGEVATIDIELTEAAVQLTGVTVVAQAPSDLRSTEVAANVSTEQIENLPQGNRNFLEFAALAPGVQQRQAGLSAGGASVSNSNLFIDGATYKSDVLPGGVAGQDPSLARQTGAGRIIGNPFPQNAVQEFRVLTQNYKAEYQKTSGALVTAATKTGTNELHGDLFFSGLTDSYIARNAFQVERALDVPNYRRSQFGGSLGGPIVQDRAHFFMSYEGNYQQTDARVLFQAPTGVTVPPSILEGQGLFVQPLRSNLFFGKATYQINDRQDLLFTVNVRDEHDERDFGGNRGVEQRVVVDNDVNTLLLRHTFAGQPFTNEAQVSFQRFNWAANPDNPDDARLIYRFPGAGVPDIIRGGNLSRQDFVQDRLSLRNDLTWVARSHVFKGGANIDFLRYDVNKRLNENPTFFFSTDRPGELTTPYEANFEIGDPRLQTNNRQIGLYIQDDWSVSPRLTLNIGVRWDYETDWLNNDFVTPSRYVDSLALFLADHPYFDIGDYTTGGDDRPNFLGAFQPRLGFSFDARGDGRTVVFGGGGLYYDRIHYNILLDEKYKIQRPRITFRFVPPGTTPGAGEIEWDPAYFEREALVQLATSGQTGFPELFLINNEQEPPYTVQGSLGVRHALGPYTLSMTGTLVNGYNYFKWIWGNRDPETGQLFFGQRGIAAILISTDEGRTWYRGLLFQLSKPFVGDARWGGDLSYTLSKTEANHWQDVEDPFALDYWPEDETLGFNRIPGRFDERHRVVLNLLTRLPFDIRFSTITTLGSGNPYTLTTGCTSPTPAPGSFCETQPIPPTFIPGFMANPAGLGPRSERPEAKWFGPFGKWAYRNVNVRFQKDVTFGAQRLGISVDVLNVFNFVNYNFANNFVYNIQSAPDVPRHPRGEFDTFDSRRVQLGAKYSF